MFCTEWGQSISSTNERLDSSNPSVCLWYGFMYGCAQAPSFGCEQLCNLQTCRGKLKQNMNARSEKIPTENTQWLHCTSFHMSIEFLTCHLKNLFLSCSENRAKQKQKQKHWAPYQTMWSEFHCQDNLKKTWAQLLPQPQEGLTSRGLTHCPASDAALYVTASTCCGEGEVVGRFLGDLDVRKQMGSSCFTLLSFCLYSSYFCLST